jgi:flagellar hook-associated protein 1
MPSQASFSITKLDFSRRENLVTTIFMALNTANTALQADQLTITTIDHNVANANTPGYSQQTVNLVAAPPYTVPSLMRPIGPPGQVGAGVEAQSITRARDLLLDGQWRYENQYNGQWQTMDTQYSQIQSIFPEPSSNGLSEKLSAFFNSWQTLADDPTNMGARASVQQAGVQVASTLNSYAQQLATAQQNADNLVSSTVTDINNLTSQIVNLNGQIAAVLATGQQPNDLMDQRDVLLDKLSSDIPITYQLQANGMVTVNAATQVPGGTTVQTARAAVPLVNGLSQTTLAVNPMGIPYYNVAGNPTYVDPTFIVPNGATTVPIGGVLGSAINVRDTVLGTPATGMIGQLNSIAQAIVQRVNNLHGTGIDASGTAIPGGTAFFNVTPPAAPLATPYTNVATVTAANITVDPAILASPNNIAAATTTSSPGDGSNAQAIANLRNSVGGLGQPLQNLTINQGYDQLISSLGANAQNAHSTNQTQTVLMNNLTAQRQSISGVSNDEQMTWLIQYQHSYSAAARIVTTIDSMLDTIVNHMGLGN